MYGYEVFHEDTVKELIDNVHKGNSRHAYLFVGPEGVGKLKVAKLFSQALTCNSPEIAPCGNCPACIGTKSETNPDIRYIRPIDDKKSVTAEQAREIVADAYIKPFESSKKIYIIEDASVLNEFAQNCLLKILEEPPEYIVFIIISTGEDELLQTVLSRCTTISFPVVSEEVIKNYIKVHYPERTEDMPLLMSLSQGIPGELDKILCDPDYEIIRQESFKMLVPLMSRHKISAYKVCEFLEDYKDRTTMIFDFWQSFLRDIIMIKNSSDKLIINKDMKDELKTLSSKMNDKFPVIVMEQIIRATKMNKRYVNLHSLGLNLSFSIKNRLYTK